MLLAAPRPWTARTSRHATPVDLKAYLAQPSLLRSGADAPVVTRFFAGAFAFASPNAALMASLTPPLIHVRATEVAAGPLGALLGLLAGEALGEAPGRALVLDRLLEIILVHALRHRPADLADPPRGLLSGLADPRLAAALTLMHTHPDRPWTVAQLGREAGMSRSAFAAHFAEVIGAPPIDYLARWRISLAKNALTEADANMARIAEQIGYASVSAFSTAFARETGGVAHRLCASRAGAGGLATTPWPAEVKSTFAERRRSGLAFRSVSGPSSPGRRHGRRACHDPSLRTAAPAEPDQLRAPPRGQGIADGQGCSAALRSNPSPKTANTRRNPGSMMTLNPSDQPVSGGYRVDVSRGERIGRVSSEWFSRPDDERYLSLTALHTAVRRPAERVEASRDNAERVTLTVPGRDPQVRADHRCPDRPAHGDPPPMARSGPRRRHGRGDPPRPPVRLSRRRRRQSLARFEKGSAPWPTRCLSTPSGTAPANARRRRSS